MSQEGGWKTQSETVQIRDIQYSIEPSGTEDNANAFGHYVPPHSRSDHTYQEGTVKTSSSSRCASHGACDILVIEPPEEKFVNLPDGDKHTRPTDQVAPLPRQ